MLKLVFHGGEHQYAIDCSYVKMIVPQMNLCEIAQSPEYVVGMMNLSGKPVPVVDFCLLVSSVPAKDCLHTRIIIFELLRNGRNILIGLKAEKVTKTISQPNEDFVESSISMDKLPFFKGSFMNGEKPIQMVDLPKLIDFVTEQGALPV